MDTATYLSLIMKIVCISDINFFFQSKQIMSTSEEIPPSAKDWVKSSALYPFSPFCWHLPLLLSSVSCSTSRCVVCLLLHVTYNLLTSASYTPRDLQSTSGIDSHHNLLWRSPAYNGYIFFREWCVFKKSKYSFVFRIICGCSLFSYTFDKLSVTRKWSIYPYLFSHALLNLNMFM